MTRRILPFLVVLAVFGCFLGTLYFLYQKSREPQIAIETIRPRRMSIVGKAIAPGSIVPRNQVEIKSRVPGVVEELYVVPGQRVDVGEKIAKIRIIPDAVTLNSAEARLAAAQISLASAKKEYTRIKQLFEKRLVPQSDFARAELDHQLARHEVGAAHRNLELVREGAADDTAKVSNIATSTVEGTVVQLPVKQGTSVIEANTFNAGTTVAVVADMTDMLFKGHVDESEVGKLSTDMTVVVSVGALNQHFDGTLEYIAPEGTDKDGTIEFEVWAAIHLKPDQMLRSNYSATAEIVLDRRTGVIAIPESIIEFEHSQAFVHVEVAPNRFDRRLVKLGLSDGLNVQVLDGVGPADSLKRGGSVPSAPH